MNLIKLNNSPSRKFVILIFTYFSILFSTCLSYDNNKNLQKNDTLNKPPPSNNTASNIPPSNNTASNIPPSNNTASNVPPSNNTASDILLLLSENQIPLITGGIVIFMLCVLYFYARRKYSQGRNTIIFTTTLIIVDLMLDLAFLVNNINQPDGRYLLIPCLVAFALPGVINLLLALAITINQRYNNKDFKFWLRDHTVLAAIMTMLSMLNIEALRMLDSKFLNKRMFDARFDRKALKLIIVGSLVNVFMGDIPQFIILVIYKSGRNEVEFIPLLTLVSSSMLLLCDLICGIYEFISH